MAVSKAQQKAQNKWIAKAYDRINLTVSKGKKEVIQAYATAQGESVNGFKNRSIDQALNASPVEMPLAPSASPPLSQGVVLLPEALEAVQEATEGTGEAIEHFVGRAVKEQAVRDRVSWRMGINPATGEKLSKGGTDHE